MKTLRSTWSTLFLFYIICLSCNNEPKESLLTETTADPELQAIQETIDGLYESIHVDKGEVADLDQLLSHFAPDARLGSVQEGKTDLKTAVEYFESWNAAMKEIKPDLLKEWEIEGKSQYFGNIAYHSSHYGVYFNNTEEMAEQGIINYQLVKLDDGWKVLSMIWQAEKPELKIPAAYFTP